MIRNRNRGLRSAAAVLGCATILTACEDGAGPPEGRVTTVEAVGGQAQQQTVGAVVSQPLVAMARDIEGRPVAGARVEWQTASGTIRSLSTVTDAEGRASAEWTLGTAAGEQFATITVGAVSTTFSATAAPGPAVAVTVTPSPVILDAIDATAELAVVARDAHDNPIEGRTPAWASTGPAIASVNAAGVVRAVSPGTTRVRATLDGASGEVEVTVAPQPASIVLDPPAAQLTALGASIQFAASTRDRNGHPVAGPAPSFTWSSSHPPIVSVSASGLATAQATGNAQVVAALGALAGQAPVTVVQAAASLTVNPATDTLTTARPTTQLVVAARDANDQPILVPAVVWSTSNVAVATVSATGSVTAVANGTVQIRATSGSAVDSATIVVRLNAPPQAVADSFATSVNATLAAGAPGLLGNDTLGIPAATIASFGGGSLGGVVTSLPPGSTTTFGTGGSLTVNANGSFNFVPSTGFTGSFTFQYRAQNSAGSSDATATIEVGGLPVAVDDAFQTTAGTILAVPAATGVMANDDRAFPLAVVASFGGGGLGGSSVTSFTAGQRVAFGVGGSVQLNADGSMSFTPPTGFTGTFSFQYRLANALAASDATITITVN